MLMMTKFGRVDNPAPAATEGSAKPNKPMTKDNGGRRQRGAAEDNEVCECRPAKEWPGRSPARERSDLSRRPHITAPPLTLLTQQATKSIAEFTPSPIARRFMTKPDPS